jgi:hypothetical protein
MLGNPNQSPITISIAASIVQQGQTGTFQERCERWSGYVPVPNLAENVLDLILIFSFVFENHLSHTFFLCSLPLLRFSPRGQQQRKWVGWMTLGATLPGFCGCSSAVYNFITRTQRFLKKVLEGHDSCMYADSEFVSVSPYTWLTAAATSIRCVIDRRRWHTISERVRYWIVLSSTRCSFTNRW